MVLYLLFSYDISQEFFDRASGGLTRLEGTHELFAVTVEWERQKVT